MTSYADRIAQRLLLEKGYAVLVDRETFPALPEDDAFRARLAAADSDEERTQVEREFIADEIAHYREQPLVGGPIGGISELLEADCVSEQVLLASQQLRSLADSAARVLVRLWGSRTCRIVLVFNNSLPANVTRETLTTLAPIIQHELNIDPWDETPEEQAEDFRQQVTAVNYDIIVVDQRGDADQLQPQLAKLDQRSRKDCNVSIRPFLFRANTGSWWTSRPLANAHYKRFYRHACKYEVPPPSELIQRVKRKRPPLATLAGYPILMLLMVFASRLVLPESIPTLAINIAIPALLLYLLAHGERVRLLDDYLFKLPLIFVCLYGASLFGLNSYLTLSFDVGVLIDQCIVGTVTLLGISLAHIPTVFIFNSDRRMGW